MAYSKLSGGTDTWGGAGSLVAVPALRLTGNDTLLPLLYANASTMDRVVEEDTFFTQRMLFLARPSYKHSFRGLDAGVRADARRMVTKEAQEEAWSTGLYDYEEFGGGAFADLAAGAFKPLSLSLDWGRRTYANFHNVNPEPDGKNWAVKNHEAWKAGVDSALVFGAGKLDLSYSYMTRFYNDCYAIRKDGTVDGDVKRRDGLHTASAGFTARPTRAALVLARQGDADTLRLGWFAPGLEVEGTWLRTNEGLYDPAFGRHQGDFYGYDAYSLRPHLDWRPSDAEDSPTLSVAYKAVFRNYTGRLVRNPDGTYAQGLQADIEHWVMLNGRAPLAWGLAVVGSASSENATSNQKYEQTLRGNFELYTFSLGLEYQL